MAQAMGVPLKTENEESAGKTLQIRGSEGGRRSVTGTCQLGMTKRVSPKPSARLTHGLELAMKVWRLRCSVFRGTPMAFFYAYFKELHCYYFSVSVIPRINCFCMKMTTRTGGIMASMVEAMMMCHSACPSPTSSMRLMPIRTV
jgi:hypothetical protein